MDTCFTGGILFRSILYTTWAYKQLVVSPRQGSQELVYSGSRFHDLGGNGVMSAYSYSFVLKSILCHIFEPLSSDSSCQELWFSGNWFPLLNCRGLLYFGSNQCIDSCWCACAWVCACYRKLEGMRVVLH